MGKVPPHLRLRQNNTHSSKKEARKESKKINNEVTVKKDEKESGGLIFPGGDTAFKALLSARSCAAIWSHITDCDETYNYWEPLHYLVFGKGLQTWEYSPEFALRSYTYLLIHATPAYIFHQLLQPNPMLIFITLRCLLGLLCAFAEVYFYKATCKEFGVHIGRLVLLFQLFSAGMFISSTALLPSSWAMYATAAATAAWWQKRYPLAIFLTALGSLLGWPFAALLGLPIVYDMIILKKMYKTFITWTAISGVSILGPMIVIDSMFYNKLVIAPWNIVKYNVLGGNGPQLYGTEPFSFYLINGFLNFNIIWVCALFLPIALILSKLFIPAKNRSTLSLPHYVSLAPFGLWLAVFMFQPHKEERFLFPIYPFICLSGAVTIDIFQKLWFRIIGFFKEIPPGSHYLDYGLFITLGTIIVSSLLGISRAAALYKNYHAPLDLMMEINKIPIENKMPNNLQINVCIGKDWYRYPNSFFLPNKNWNIRFLQSEFKGILPAPYSETENGTTIIHSHFNDKNMEEPSLYFQESKCHFLLDIETGRQTELEPNYITQKDKWKLIKSLPFLDTENSNKIFRAFYVPYVSEHFIKYNDFHLLQSVKLKLNN